jgi:hypothetical protein
MDRNINFSKMSNSEINLKLKSYDNEYDIRKSKIIELVHELEDLDFLYKKASEELKKRGVLSDE